jgi:hypothetical protein
MESFEREPFISQDDCEKPLSSRCETGETTKFDRAKYIRPSIWLCSTLLLAALLVAQNFYLISKPRDGFHLGWQTELGALCSDTHAHI